MHDNYEIKTTKNSKEAEGKRWRLGEAAGVRKKIKTYNKNITTATQ